MKTIAHKVWFVFNGVLESFSLCFNVYSLFSLTPFLRSPITAAASPFKILIRGQPIHLYSGIHAYYQYKHMHTHKYSQVFGSAECICLLPLESKHHLLMNKLSDPLSFSLTHAHAPDSRSP